MEKPSIAIILKLIDNIANILKTVDTVVWKLFTCFRCSFHTFVYIVSTLCFKTRFCNMADYRKSLQN